jgi:hypothetical protein
MLSRQKFAERRALLTPLLQKLCQAFCALHGEGTPPFRLSIPIRSTSANWCAANNKHNASPAWRPPAIVPH